MKAVPLTIPDVMLLEPRVFGDARGFFFESFKRMQFLMLTGREEEFVQDNHSRSAQGVLRGLHYQLPPHAQGKLVRVTSGTVFDVAVDIRKGSPTFGKYVAETLSADNKYQLFIPRGFANGFLVLEEDTVFCYKCDNFYVLGSERGICYRDTTLGVRWPDIGMPPLLSDKDMRLPFLEEVEPWDGDGRPLAGQV
jgi:dTDP-4-dehydrorhamnose 3,5-epimerase